MEYTKNMILKITNIGTVGMNGTEFDRDFKAESSELKDQRVTRELLKDYFQKYGYVKHVDYRAGQEQATIRFSERDGDLEICKRIIDENAQTPLVLGQQQVKMEIVTGEEEEAIYKSIIERGQNRRDGGFQRGGYGGGRGDYQDRRPNYGGDRRYGDRNGGDRSGGYGGDRNGGYGDRNSRPYGDRPQERRGRDDRRDDREYQ